MDNRFNGVLAPAREASGNKAALTGGEPSHYQWRADHRNWNHGRV